MQVHTHTQEGKSIVERVEWTESVGGERERKGGREGGPGIEKDAAEESEDSIPVEK